VDNVNGFHKKNKIYNLGMFLFKVSLIYAFYIASITDFSNGQNSDVGRFITIFFIVGYGAYPFFRPKIKCPNCNENLSGTYTRIKLKVVVCPYCAKSIE